MNAADLFRLLRRLASQNLGLKVVALALAVAAWWFVAGESKVLVGFTIPLEIRNVPRGLTMTNKPEREVEVRLSGPSALLSGMRPSEISAGVDLTGARAGRQYFTLDDRAVKVPPGIKLQRIFPPSIEVILERTERRTVPVSVRIGGGAALRKRVAKVEVDPPSVEVEALPEEFSRMPVVYTEEVAPERTEGDYSAIARVETREAHAKIVGNPNVRVTIQFRK
ncbi:CdaR family protein [Candidatus Deferrimicrobium sp.]|uniref:CdaR family protein n=1 Tax=Candidatus Deferrimicrobium sp. TaxID=3060586 RepID=UPI003C6B6759